MKRRTSSLDFPSGENNLVSPRTSPTSSSLPLDVYSRKNIFSRQERPGCVTGDILPVNNPFLGLSPRLCSSSHPPLCDSLAPSFPTTWRDAKKTRVRDIESRPLPFTSCRWIPRNGGRERRRLDDSRENSPDVDESLRSEWWTRQRFIRKRRSKLRKFVERRGFLTLCFFFPFGSSRVGREMDMV